MPYQNLSRTLTAQQMDDLRGHIAGMQSILDFLVVLTPDERRSLYKIGNARVAYVRKTQEAAREYPQVLPGDFDMTEFDNDATLYAQLSEINGLLQVLAAGLNDTQLAVGSEAVQASSSVYT